MTFRLAVVRAIALPVFLVAVTTSPARAVEVGIDLGLDYQSIDNDGGHAINFGIPANDGVSFLSVTSVRVGLPVGRAGQFEPSLGFSLSSLDDGFGDATTLAHLVAGLSYLQAFSSADPTRSPYVRFGVQGRQIMISDVPGASQFGAGAGLGYRWRMGTVFGGRIEGHAARWFETDDFIGHTDFSVRFGFSAFSS